MKIIAVCGMGMGSALLIRMNIEKVAKKLGLDATVSTVDIGTARGAGMDADIIIASSHLVDRLGEVKAKIVALKNIMSEEELTEKLSQAIADME